MLKFHYGPPTTVHPGTRSRFTPNPTAHLRPSAPRLGTQFPSSPPQAASATSSDLRLGSASRPGTHHLCAHGVPAPDPGQRPADPSEPPGSVRVGGRGAHNHFRSRTRLRGTALWFLTPGTTAEQGTNRIAHLEPPLSPRRRHLNHRVRKVAATVRSGSDGCA